jgi:hypothetical protein
MSTPFIAGLAGLLRSLDPLLTTEELKNALYTSGSNYPLKFAGAGYGVPDGYFSASKVMGIANRNIIKNRLTPLFGLFNEKVGDSLYTTSPHMAVSALNGEVFNTNSGGSIVSSYVSTGEIVGHYDYFLRETEDSNGTRKPRANVYIFSGEKNPFNPHQPLVPLYRLIFSDSYSARIDNAYTTSSQGLDYYTQPVNGTMLYAYEGIEGYIFSNKFPQPSGTVPLYRRYNEALDDHAIFPEKYLNEMHSKGYTTTIGNNDILGYVFENKDSDGDLLIDGFEQIIGTCIQVADSDQDGKLDGEEVLSYPRTDPISSSLACSSEPEPTPTPVYGSPITPLFEYLNANNSSIMHLIGYDLAIGYNFIPEKNGVITKLGALVAETNIVRLFNKSTGELLAESSVESGGQWKYATITPVEVVAGAEYSIAVYLAGKEGKQVLSGGYSFPITVGDIKITSGVGGFTGENPNIRPNTIINILYGIPDIEFKAEAN